MTAPNTSTNLADSKNKLGIATALVLISFATVVYTLVVFKLLSFFIMPSLFFDLLFIGFPLGALLGASFFQVNLKSFTRTIWILQLALLASTIAVLFAHNFNYLRIHLFDVQVSQLLVNISIFTCLFIPFFIAYGLSEYIGYQVGRQRFKAKMHTVYALYLFGAAGAYLLTNEIIPRVGVVSLILGALLMTAVVGWLISTGRNRKMFLLQLILMVSCLFIPKLEANFLRIYKGISPLSTRYFQAQGFQSVFQKWGKYSLNEILETPDSSAYYGFYNDFLQWEYYPERGYNKPSLGTIPIMLMSPGSRKLIIGSGGGRQVRFATVNGHSNITAVEVEPAVIEAVRSPQYLKQEFREVYDQPGVKVVRSEGRKYLNELEEAQDLIYLPSVGGYPQMMLEPGNMIRTYEAYQMAADKLTDDGIFAIWYPAGLDAQGVLTDQYVLTLRELGMQVRAYRNDQEFLILSTASPQMKLPESREIMDLLVATYEKAGGSFHSFPVPLIPADYQVTPDPQFQPVSDDQPYLGGNLSHIFSRLQVYQLYGFGAGVLLILGLILYAVMSKKGNPKIPHRSFNALAGLAFLLGANFLLVEHHLVLLLFQYNYVFHDALMQGAVVYLILTGVGSMLGQSTAGKVVILLSIPCYLLLAVGVITNVWASLVLIIPVAIASGTFFPRLFEKAASNPLGVFALDAIGAGFGSLLAAAVPILFGFHFYGYIALIFFVITLIVDRWFHRSPVPLINA